MADLSQTNSTLPGVRRAWAWVAHLRDGGTTPWADWSGTVETSGRYLPGAQQLEVLRRLNLAGTPSARLRERVLVASAPGRGRPDLELRGAVDELAFGPPPVDPGELPADELLRVASGLVAEDVVERGLPEPVRPGVVRPWRRRYHLTGDPDLVEPMRAQLVRRGRPPGGTGAVVLVVGTSLDRMLIDAWTSRCFDAGAPSWRSWLEQAAERNGLPRRADLHREARAWAQRVGAQRVHVVLEPHRVARLLGLRRALTIPPPLAADAVELARRVAVPLGLLVPEERRAELLAALRPQLSGLPGAPLALPAEHEGWVARRAARMKERLLDAGYAVHGDPDALLPRGAGGGAGASDSSEDRALALALRMLLDHDAQRAEEAT